MRGIDRQMVDQSTPAVVPAQRGRDDCSAGLGAAAQVGIPFEIGPKGLFIVSLRNLHPVAFPPEREHSGVIRGDQGANLEFRLHIL